MTQLIQWISRRKFLNICLIIVYFVMVVAPHKKFGTFINTVIFKGIPRADSNLYVLIGALISLLIYGSVFYWNALKRDDPFRLWFYMIFNVLVATVIINLLFVNNVEVVHFPQYAFFAILSYPLIGNYTATLVWSTIAGAIDEAYQYFYLAPMDTSYYDLNDVVTNLVGAVFGLLLLRSFGIKEYSIFRLKSSTIWFGVGGIFLALIILHLTGLLSIYPNAERPFHILREWPPGFWSTVPPEVTFHVIRPLEGLILTIILLVFYQGLAPKYERE